MFGHVPELLDGEDPVTGRPKLLMVCFMGVLNFRLSLALKEPLKSKRISLYSGVRGFQRLLLLCV